MLDFADLLPSKITALFGGTLTLGVGAWLITTFPVFGPILVGVAKIVEGFFEAVADIVVALAGSERGRWVLAAIVIAVALLYGRWHYINQGYVTGHATQKTCPVPSAFKRR